MIDCDLGAKGNVSSSNQSHADSYVTIGDIEQFLYSKVLIAICSLGILGNVLNLLVLTRKGLQNSMDRMERSVHTGLIALAVSDMLLCILLLPHAWLTEHSFYYETKGFTLLYRLYSEGLINIFIMCSSWLTVIMASSRYLAICHPLRAREIIGMTFARASVAVVFLLCVLFNLPRFWREEIDSLDCKDGRTVYYGARGFPHKYPICHKVYLSVYFCLGILIPIFVLAFCNLHLIKALRRSSEMRQRYNPTTVYVEGAHRFTLTLVVIVIMYIVLVTPSDIVNFVKEIPLNDTSHTSIFNLILAIANVMQAVNFAFNYVLYCIVNVHFRRTMKAMICEKIRGTPTEVPPAERIRYDSLTATTGLLVLPINASRNHIPLSKI